MKQIFAIAAILGAALTFALAGCGKDPMSSKAGGLTLNLKAMSGNPGLPGVAGWASLSKSVLRFSASTPSAQAQPVTITTAKLVLGKIEIESSGGDSLDFKSRNALVVDLNLTGGLTNLGTVDMRIWFSDRAGNFLDPRASQNQNAFERNIKASIDAFEDDLVSMKA